MKTRWSKGVVRLADSMFVRGSLPSDGHDRPQSGPGCGLGRWGKNLGADAELLSKPDRLGGFANNPAEEFSEHPLGGMVSCQRIPV